MSTKSRALLIFTGAQGNLQNRCTRKKPHSEQPDVSHDPCGNSLLIFARLYEANTSCILHTVRILVYKLYSLIHLQGCHLYSSIQAC